MTINEDPKNSDAWRDYALHLRDILTQLGVDMDPCGPGEEQDCGHTFAVHCITYTAALQAKAEDRLRHLHHGDHAAEELAHQLLAHWRNVFAAEGHH